LDAELARLDLREMPADDFDPERLPTVQRAREQEQNALRRYERAKELRRTNVVSQEFLEYAETEYNVAVRTREQTLLEAWATLAAARHRAAVLASAINRREKTRIKAPVPHLAAEFVSGPIEYHVAKRRVAEGAMLKDAPGTSTAVFDLVLDKVLKYAANVPERYIGEVAVGQTVAIRVDAHPRRVFQGKLTRLSPTVDRSARTFQIEVTVPNGERLLRPGGFGKGEILTREESRVLTVSPAAVVTLVGSSKVFVVYEGKARAVPVALGVEGPGWVELLEFDPRLLNAESLVIASGHNLLAEGIPVTPRLATSAEQQGGN
jgi:membrane fusion protein (multidrug efflux system)